MTENELVNDRKNSNADRQSEANQVPEEKKQRRLDNGEALVFMFTIAMMPGYVIPARFQLDDRSCGSAWLITFILIIVCSALFNYITLNILNRVADVKQMESYQEVAYNISNSNRGYIFLISAAKFILLAVTAAYAINYCANYATLLCL